MRGVAVLALAVLVTGCGSHRRHSGATTAASDGPIVVGRPSRAGHWTKLLLSPDRSTYLAQWSGECEIQTAYFVPAGGGRPRPVTNYANGSAESLALGWAGSKARIRLPQGQPPDRKPGVYLVDPKTMAMTLARRTKPRRGC
jgi:hypothetical protein